MSAHVQETEGTASAMVDTAAAAESDRLGDALVELIAAKSGPMPSGGQTNRTARYRRAGLSSGRLAASQSRQVVIFR